MNCPELKEVTIFRIYFICIMYIDQDFAVYCTIHYVRYQLRNYMYNPGRCHFGVLGIRIFYGCVA